MFERLFHKTNYKIILTYEKNIIATCVNCMLGTTQKLLILHIDMLESKGHLQSIKFLLHKWEKKINLKLKEQLLKLKCNQ